MEHQLKPVGEMTEEEIIKHYGVKGMKWGVRKIRQRASKKQASIISKAETQLANTKKAVSVHETGGEKAYSKEHYNNLKDAAWAVQPFDGNAERTLHTAAFSVRKKEPLGQRVSKKEVSDALKESIKWQEDDLASMREQQSLIDSKIDHGWEIMYEEMKPVSEMSEEEILQHYGVKGMKWGVRKARSAGSHFKEIGSNARKMAKAARKGPSAMGEEHKRQVNADLAKAHKRDVKILKKLGLKKLAAEHEKAGPPTFEDTLGGQAVRGAKAAKRTAGRISKAYNNKAEEILSDSGKTANFEMGVAAVAATIGAVGSVALWKYAN